MNTLHKLTLLAALAGPAGCNSKNPHCFPEDYNQTVYDGCWEKPSEKPSEEPSPEQVEPEPSTVILETWTSTHNTTSAPEICETPDNTGVTTILNEVLHNGGGICLSKDNNDNTAASVIIDGIKITCTNEGRAPHCHIYSDDQKNICPNIQPSSEGLFIYPTGLTNMQENQTGNIITTITNYSHLTSSLPADNTCQETDRTDQEPLNCHATDIEITEIAGPNTTTYCMLGKIND